mmetsp:Transcript_4532/g.12823  ORF Transcript_4532/g.12823 Transcript_4532/m.12823 type:complete len:237 (-) Transcript_4532:1395-2105(-)
MSHRRVGGHLRLGQRPLHPRPEGDVGARLRPTEVEAEPAGRPRGRGGAEQRLCAASLARRAAVVGGARLGDDDAVGVRHAAAPIDALEAIGPDGMDLQAAQEQRLLVGAPRRRPRVLEGDLAAGAASCTHGAGPQLRRDAPARNGLRGGKVQDAGSLAKQLPLVPPAVGEREAGVVPDLQHDGPRADQRVDKPNRLVGDGLLLPLHGPLPLLLLVILLPDTLEVPTDDADGKRDHA